MTPMLPTQKHKINTLFKEIENVPDEPPFYLGVHYHFHSLALYSSGKPLVIEGLN